MVIRELLERLVIVLVAPLWRALIICLLFFQMPPGKEILYPVATVILGGLLSSRLLDIIVTPVVFHLFGEKALQKYLESKQSK